MAQYGKINLLPRILVFMLLIFLMSIIGLIWFDYLGVIDTREEFSPLLELVGVKSASPINNSSDPYLLDRDRLSKLQDAIKLQEEELDLREADLDSHELELKQISDELTEKQKAQEDRENSFNERVRLYDDKKENIRENARKLTGMPPAESVAILLRMDDQSIIDHLRTTEEIAQEEGTSSLVSYWLSLMPSDRAAEIMRKMAKRPGS
ncbi:periplasmic-type flagellar collar protein FlbB [Spirochaeta cellobiosiphila]|uniref:periplasmic-type flagellar collar protein FlbB n=1 Tax=Spirochaeta cellobiosiphila TaxID=504483 RepID=UPI000412927A|nr:hypothetical protein [Spirochaeta cellobiosiphila]